MFVCDACRLGEWRLLEDKLRDAEMFLTRALQIIVGAHSKADLSTIKALKLLSAVYNRQDRAHDAVPLLKRCLAMQDNLLGGDHPESVSTRKLLQEASVVTEASFMMSSGNLETISS